MKQNHRILIALILFVALFIYFFILFVQSGKAGFTPRLRAAVRPHVRTLHRGYGGIVSVFSWDNWRRGLRTWNL